MSLISQNATSTSRNRTRRSERDDDSGNVLLGEGDKLIEDREGSDSDTPVVTKKRKKVRVEDQKVIENEKNVMKNLQNSLFASIYSPLGFESEHVEAKTRGEEEEEEDSALIFIDKSAYSELSAHEDDDDDDDCDDCDKSDVDEETKERKPVWVDEEEEKTSVNIATVGKLRKLRKEEDESIISGKVYVSRLRAEHHKMNRGTEWARLDSKRTNYDDDDESSDDENGVVEADGHKDVGAVDDLLRTNEDLVVKSTGKLLPGLLEYSRLVDANAEEPSNASITSVQFHRNAQLLLTAGLDRRLRFFQIDGKRNSKIQSIYLDDCPIRKAAFVPDGSKVIIAGRRKFFYSFDLVKATVDKIGPLTGREEKSLEVFEVSPDSSTVAFVGNEGYILLVSTKTKELIGTVKMNGTVRSLAFADDGRQLLSSGGDGHVYHWDLRTRTCFHKGVDVGCINGTSLCTSPTGNLFAAGSSSGIVNVYNRDEFLGGKRKPIKTIENLTTKIDVVKFNSDAQILAICSTMKQNSLKLVHVPTLTVFSNWPPSNKTLQYPRCLDFSPGGGFMAFGNSAGKVLLYKLHHYNHA